jgi:hypothetical protein
VGSGERSAGRSDSGTLSMRYAVPGVLIPGDAVVKCARADRRGRAIDRSMTT